MKGNQANAIKMRRQSWKKMLDHWRIQENSSKAWNKSGNIIISNNGRILIKRWRNYKNLKNQTNVYMRQLENGRPKIRLDGWNMN